MLPEFLAGSYKRYKQDTALFTTWLAKAAASVGYKPNSTKRSPSDQPVLSKPPVATGSSGVTKPSGRLKGKERKAAKDAADKARKANESIAESQVPSTVKYTITTGELLRQAEAVTRSHVTSAVKIPASLRGVLERAIRARRRCSEWFQKSKVHNEYADKQHTHFIEILEQSLKILEPCVEAEDTGPKDQRQNLSAYEDAASVTNRFSMLKVEESPEADPAEVFEIANAVNVATKSKASNGEPEITVYELEDEDKFDEELAFIIFCFFEDLHRTQEYVKELWRKYKARQCDLHTAAITTIAAFDLVRQAEEDLITQAPHVFNRKRSYESIAIIVFYADAFQQGVCPEARLSSNEFLRITPFDDFIYLSAARILMKFTFLADLPKDCNLPYPVPCPPLRFGYISRPELLGTPEMNRIEQEDLVLSRLIIDRQIWNTFKHEYDQRITLPPLEDEFSQSLDRLTTNGVLSAALVFEARVFLDIQDIMGDDVKRGYQDLLRTTTAIDQIMNLKAVNGAWDVGGSGERWHEKDVDVVMRIKQTSIYWILDNPSNMFPKFKEVMLAGIGPELDKPMGVTRPGPSSQSGPPPLQATMLEAAGVGSLREPNPRPPKNPKLSTVSMQYHRVPEGVDPWDPNFQLALRKQLVKEGALADEGPMDPRHEENARRLNIKMIRPSEDLNYLFTSNPIYCGLVSFGMLTDYEAAGVSLCNWHKSIWPTAHLYNALQRTSTTSKPWQEMDKLINLHMDTLFAGQVPLSAHEFFVRFALALGLSMSNFSRNPRNRSNNDRIRFRQGAKGTKLKGTEMSSVFRQYFEKKLSLEMCLLKLDSLIRDPGPKASRKEREVWTRPLTNLQFLAMLESELPRVTQRLQFDYITLTKQCVKLLKLIRQRIELQFQVLCPRLSTEDSADQTLTWVVMQILEENNDVALACQSAPIHAQGHMIGPQLKVAEEEIQKFLGTYRPQDLISNFNALPRPARAPSGLVPNHWNISIRHVALSPPGDLVFLVQPDSEYVHSEGPIQIVEGQPPGHVLNPKSLVTLQTIARLIMKAFVESTGAGSAISPSAPWSWKTNDENFARRIIKVMTDMGVREDLMNMAVADAEELATCDGAWHGFKDSMNRLMTGNVRSPGPI
ncbi:MAG: hypothetical protein LQ343_002479 [Gyalolechia ehrenbergii]|nr:MAG: hypothetical protein LQ343_002479 [Gyalolechia ehrenbergii]